MTRNNKCGQAMHIHLVNITPVWPNPDRDKITFAGANLLETNKGVETLFPFPRSVMYPIFKKLIIAEHHAS